MQEGRKENYTQAHRGPDLACPAPAPGERNNTEMNALVCHFLAMRLNSIKALVIMSRLQDPEIHKA